MVFLKRTSFVLAHGGFQEYDLFVRYKTEIIQKAKFLRGQGKTYGEIRDELCMRIPKSTFSSWFKGIELPVDYSDRVKRLNLIHLNKVRSRALEINARKREAFFRRLNQINLPISSRIKDRDIAKIALAMLCLGEASKYSPIHRGFCLGNSNPKIIVLFLKLLQSCFDDFQMGKIRCTVQCRADQDTEALKEYWSSVTKVPKEYFYKPQIDPRTYGKPTLKPDYKGVLRVDYFDTKVQLELESLADLVYNYVQKFG